MPSQRAPGEDARKARVIVSEALGVALIDRRQRVEQGRTREELPIKRVDFVEPTRVSQPGTVHAVVVRSISLFVCVSYLRAAQQLVMAVNGARPDRTCHDQSPDRDLKSHAAFM
jgi:hypothetical protein